METLNRLFENNRAWAESMRKEDPDFFRKLSEQQSPHYFWIGCSDSRVPANQIIGMLPGEVFVHRNIANLVVHSDLNCLSALQFAVEILKVEQIIVCGHYGCGGVRATLRGDRLGLADNWLRHLQDVRQQHRQLLEKEEGETQASNRLCEINVIEQVANVCLTTVVRDAWERGQKLAVNGLIYSLEDGLLRDLETTVSDAAAAPKVHERAINRLVRPG